MHLNRVEFHLMNNPLRAWAQRRIEGPRLLALGGPPPSGRVLEIGCGRGVGTEVILDLFDSDEVDAFDLDPRMIRLARSRLASREAGVRLWVGDAAAIAAPDETYAAVFDFGIVHHVPDWRRALAEVHRVLRPGGMFYGEEILARMLDSWPIRRLLDHPRQARFTAPDLAAAIVAQGFDPPAMREIWGCMAWFSASKPAA